MSKRLVLAIDESLTLRNLKAFVMRAEEMGIKQTVPLMFSEDAGTYLFSAPLSEAALGGRRVVIRRVKPTKKQAAIKTAAKKQIKERKEQIKEGKAVPGHVDPVKGVKKAKKRRKKRADSSKATPTGAAGKDKSASAENGQVDDAPAAEHK